MSEPKENYEGADVRPVQKAEVPTIRAYADDPFMKVYSASHKPSSRRDKKQRSAARSRSPIGCGLRAFAAGASVVTLVIARWSDIVAFFK